MGLGHNDPWVESHIRPQQMWGQRSSRGKWPLVQVFAKNITVSTYFHVCSGETRGSRTTCWQSVDAILKDVYVTEAIVWCSTMNSKTIILQCSKNYGSPTLVTRLKVAPNMVDPISLNEKALNLHKMGMRLALRPVTKSDLEGVQNPKMWLFWTQKVEFLNLTSSTPYKNPFLTHFVA